MQLKTRHRPAWQLKRKRIPTQLCSSSGRTAYLLLNKATVPRRIVLPDSLQIHIYLPSETARRSRVTTLERDDLLARQIEILR